MKHSEISTTTERTPLVSMTGLRDLLTPVLGSRPSREFLVDLREKGMPYIPLGPRTILYRPEAVLSWIEGQEIRRSQAPAVVRDSGCIIRDPRVTRTPR